MSMDLQLLLRAELITPATIVPHLIALELLLTRMKARDFRVYGEALRELGRREQKPVERVLPPVDVDW